MSADGVLRTKRWLWWACDKVGERFEQGNAHMRAGCKALAEEQLLIGKAMLELIKGFQEMVLDDPNEKADQ